MSCKTSTISRVASSAPHTPNWLLIWLIIVSLIFHCALIYNSKRFKTKHLSSIELTIQDILQPVTPYIPRPKTLPSSPQVVARIPEPTPHPAPREKMVKTVAETIPDTPVIQNLPLTKWHPTPPSPPIVKTISEPAAKKDRSVAQQNYLSLVQRTIESHKKYPLAARRRQIEGQLCILFRISSTGMIHHSQITQSSGHEILDQAALRAVSEASPLPTPPAGLFDGDTALDLTIVFKMI